MTGLVPTTATQPHLQEPKQPSGTAATTAIDTSQPPRDDQPPHQQHRVPRRRALMLAVALMLVATACSAAGGDSSGTNTSTRTDVGAEAAATAQSTDVPDDDQSDPTGDTTTTAADSRIPDVTSTDSEQPSAEFVPPPDAAISPTADDDQTEAILAAYQGFWDTWLAANDPPDPDHPDLRRYYTGPAYKHVIERITTYRAGGFRVSLPPNSRSSHNPVVSEVSPDAMTAFVTDCAIDDGIISVAATGEVLNDEIKTMLFRTELRKIDDQWRVFDNSIVDQWPGAVACTP